MEDNPHISLVGISLLKWNGKSIHINMQYSSFVETWKSKRQWASPPIASIIQGPGAMDMQQLEEVYKTWEKKMPSTLPPPPPARRPRDRGNNECQPQRRKRRGRTTSLPALVSNCLLLLLLIPCFSHKTQIIIRPKCLGLPVDIFVKGWGDRGWGWGAKDENKMTLAS